MKQIEIAVISNGKTLETIDLLPVTQLRLQAFAKVNGRISLLEMIDLAARHAISSEESPINLMCPEEDDILALAAKMLATASA